MPASWLTTQHLELELEPGCALVTLPGNLSHLEADLHLKSSLYGGLPHALFRRLCSRMPARLLQINNPTESSRHLGLVHPLPGDLICQTLSDQKVTLTQHAFLACDLGVKIRMQWAGIGSVLSGQGIFHLNFSGSGRIWFAGFGALVEKNLDGELLLDPGYLVAFEDGLRFLPPSLPKLLLCLVRGEGSSPRLSGRGKLYLQSRSLRGLADWLNNHS